MVIYTGEPLAQYVKDHLDPTLKPRPQLEVLKKWLNRDPFGKYELEGYSSKQRTNTCALIGLKYTGKTTLLLQAMNSLDERTLRKSKLCIVTGKDDGYWGLHDAITTDTPYVFLSDATLSKDVYSLPLVDDYRDTPVRFVIEGDSPYALVYTHNQDDCYPWTLIHTNDNSDGLLKRGSLVDYSGREDEWLHEVVLDPIWQFYMGSAAYRKMSCFLGAYENKDNDDLPQIFEDVAKGKAEDDIILHMLDAAGFKREMLNLPWHSERTASGDFPELSCDFGKNRRME